MWSQYGDIGKLVDDRKLISIGGSDRAQDIYMPYVVNDITTFFTLLVGIYFPSVTGEAAVFFCFFITSLLFCLFSLVSFCFLLLCRHHGWFQPLGRLTGRPEVDPHRHHPGHCHHLLYLYPCLSFSI